MEKQEEAGSFVRANDIHWLLWAVFIGFTFLTGCDVLQVPSTPTIAPTPISTPVHEVIQPTVETSPTIFAPLPTVMPLEQDELKHIGFDVIAQIGGTTRAVALANNTQAYIGIGPRLFLVDVSDQQEPHIIGRSDLLPGLVQAVVVRGQDVFVGAGSHLITMAFSEEKTMLEITTDLTLPGFLIQGMALSDDTLYVTSLDCEETCSTGQLAIVDVTDHLRPNLANVVDLPHIPGDVTAAGDYLYVTDSGQGIDIFEAQTASEPRLVTTLMTESGAESLALTEQLLFAGLSNGKVAVFDVSEPTVPQLFQETSATAGVVEDLYNDGEYLYWTTVFCDVGLCHRNFDKIAIQNSSQEAEQSVETTGLVVMDDIAYISTENGLEIMDWGAARPFTIGVLDSMGPVSRVAVSNNTVLAVGDRSRLTAIDVSSEPAISGIFISTKQCETCRFGFIDVAASDQVAYLSAWADGLRVAALDNSATLPELGRITVVGDIRDLDLIGNYLYTVGDELRVWDVSDPANVSQRGQVVGGWQGSALFVAGDYAYVATPYSGLHVFEVADPDNLRDIAHIDVERDLTSVMVVNQYAFVTSATCSYLCTGGFYVIDVSNPAQPWLVATLPVAKGVSDVIVRDGLALLGVQACGSGSCAGGLLVVDVSDVGQLWEVFSMDLPGRITDLAIGESGHVYAAANNAGLFILQPRP